MLGKWRATSASPLVYNSNDECPDAVLMEYERLDRIAERSARRLTRFRRGYYDGYRNSARPGRDLAPYDDDGGSAIIERRDHQYVYPDYLAFLRSLYVSGSFELK